MYTTADAGTPEEEYANRYYFYHYDIRGSVTNIVGDDGKLVKGYEYDEYGNTTDGGEESFINEVTFTGSVRDLGSGLQYMNARYYDPATGRFVSQDTYTGTPYAPWTQHLYSYCGNNPVNMVDPTGHMPIKPIAVNDGGSTRVVPEPQESGEDSFDQDSIWGAILNAATYALKTGRSRHNAVRDALAAHLGGTIEYKIPGGAKKGNIGYADVYVKVNGVGMIYEIKPLSWYGKSTGRKQLARYIENANKISDIPVIAGSRVENFETVQFGDETLYITQGVGKEAGVIYYSTTPDRKVRPQNVEVPSISPESLAFLIPLLAPLLKGLAEGSSGSGGRRGAPKPVTPSISFEGAAAVAFGLGLTAYAFANTGSGGFNRDEYAFN